MSQDLARARTLDAADALADFAQMFAQPAPINGQEVLYLCGNSLGLQPHAAAQAVQDELNDWARLGVNGHFKAKNPWLSAHRAAAPLLAQLLGCETSETVAMNTLTVNLNLLMLSFYRPTDKRWKILIEADAFPSDRYAVQSQIALHGRDPAQGIVEWHNEADGLSVATLEGLLNDNPDIALILVPGVQYLSGEVLDMGAIATLAQQHNIPLGLDLAHAIGNVEIKLSAWNVDFAVWCSYKYLNAGPGAIAGAYVNSRHHNSDLPRLHGWWGNDEANRFAMGDEFTPAAGADAWQQSNPPVLALVSVIASLGIFVQAGMPEIRKKSIALTGFLRELIERDFADDIVVLTPAQTHRQGAQLSLAINNPAIDAKAVFKQLEAHAVIADWREPNVIRIAPAPLYNSFEQCVVFTERLQQALDSVR